MLFCGESKLSPSDGVEGACEAFPAYSKWQCDGQHTRGILSESNEMSSLEDHKLPFKNQ